MKASKGRAKLVTLVKRYLRLYAKVELTAKQEELFEATKDELRGELSRGMIVYGDTVIGMSEEGIELWPILCRIRP